MFCRKCGRPNDDTGYKCTNCGELLQGLQVKAVDNNLVLAIIVTVLCCLPFGVVGIVYAAQVSSKALSGDIAGAEESARKARLWSYWGLGLGLVFYSLYVLIGLTTALEK